MVESKKTGPMIGMSPSSGSLIAENVAGEFSVLAVGHHEVVVQVPGEAEDQRVQHHAEDDLVHPVADGEDGEQHPDQRASQRPAQQAQPQRARAAGHDGSGERAEQQLALDGDVDHARAGAHHPGQCPQHDRNRIVKRALQQVHHVERRGLAGVGPAQQGDDEQEDDRPNGHSLQHRAERQERPQGGNHEGNRAAHVTGDGCGQGEVRHGHLGERLGEREGRVPVVRVQPQDEDVDQPEHGKRHRRQPPPEGAARRAGGHVQVHGLHLV